MKTYECYFDASYKDKTGRAAYYLECDGQIVHHKAYQISVNSSNDAEAQALCGLLGYIKYHVEHGSALSIYGDSMFVINYVLGVSDGKYEKLKNLYLELSENFDLKLACIPRKLNKLAHALSRGGNAQLKKNVFVSTVRVPLANVSIPHYSSFKRDESKNFQRQLEFYMANKELVKRIRVDEDFNLLGGFISCLILKEHGISEYDVDVYKTVSIE